ncbi:MAG: hypothetical protein RL341_2065 [Pseudomonadota bacterium]|jgi:hypothetical protein
MAFFKRVVSSFTAVCVLGLSMPAFAHIGGAPIITTEEIATSAQSAQLKDQVRSLLERAEVKDALQKHGVDPSQVQGRVDALTDAEATQLAQQLEQMPAGGDILGILFAVFIILLVTDILGLTKVFPFTRSVR